MEVARFRFAGKLHRPFDVLGKNTRRQSIDTVVGQRERFFDRVEGCYSNRWPEQFVAGNTHVRMDISNHGRRIDRTAPSPPPTSRAPPATASLIQSSTRAASLSLTMGPTFDCSSS